MRRSMPSSKRSKPPADLPAADGPVRIGTRGSQLALLQARMIERALIARGVACELVTIRTTGDKRGAEPFAEIGAKGLFTKELETALLRGRVDCCVHSLKDLPTAFADGIELGAVLEREDPRDVLVVSSFADGRTLAELPAGSRVGTSSLRRRALLRHARPDLEAVELRGNVPTRLKKLDAGSVHAAILAAAGLLRLGARQRITAWLEPPDWLPAPGQGAIAVQIRSGDQRMRELLQGVHHGPTDIAVRAERSLLAGLEGGCQVPIGALTMREGDTLRLHGFISDLNGRQLLRGSVLVDESAPEHAGQALAQDLRARGAGSLLVELRGAGRVLAPQPE
jgi:hydroxymethylbilane synthase